MKYAAQVKFNPNLRYMHKATVLLREHAKSSEDAGSVLKRYYVPTRQVDLIKQALPEPLQKENIYVCRTTLDLNNFENELKPHVHTEEKCVLNYYITVTGEETSFFEGEIEQDDDLVTDNGNQYFMVKTDKLTKVEAFTAKVGDAWLLSTSQPHQVYVPERQEKVRDILQVYFFDLDINQVAKHFEVLQ